MSGRRGPLTGIGVPDLSVPSDEQFDQQLAADGWDVVLAENHFLGEQVKQLPRSGIIVMPSQTNGRSDKEYHFIVHQVGPVTEHFANTLKLEVGDRVVISGNATDCFFNKMQFTVIPLNSVRAVMRRKDGVKFLGSIFGERAIPDGKPAERKPDPSTN